MLAAQNANKKFEISNVGTMILIILFLLIWEGLVRYQVIDPFFFSQPLNILVDLFKMFASGEIFRHLGITMNEALTGLVFGGFAGVLMAFIFGEFPPVARIFDPIIVALYGIPKLALGPLFILWFGLGIKSKIFMAGLMVFFLVFFNAYSGFKSVDSGLINAAKLMGASRRQVLFKVVFPSCLPWIMTGIRAGLGASFLGAIVGEYIGASKGLGWMIQYAGSMYNTTRILSSILLLMIVMGTMDACLKQLEKHFLRWRPTN